MFTIVTPESSNPLITDLNMPAVNHSYAAVIVKQYAPSSKNKRHYGASLLGDLLMPVKRRKFAAVLQRRSVTEEVFPTIPICCFSAYLQVSLSRFPAPY
jgi:hypothetical protein